MGKETANIPINLLLKFQKDQQALNLIKKLVETKDYNNQEDLVDKISNIIEKSKKMDEKFDSLV